MLRKTRKKEKRQRNEPIIPSIPESSFVNDGERGVDMSEIQAH